MISECINYYVSKALWIQQVAGMGRRHGKEIVGPTEGI